MYLRTLQLHGFKSFAEKTTLQFDPGVTAIVGPNGCGKSNVIDAVRWVLGEQRARLLRSDKMESVIFNGTSKRRALGLAEVSLTIENNRGVLPTAYSEVTVARRLYRSGDSEYLLNGTVCRLKDILDLFMDTGLGAGAYSVIELKMIEDILSENAADRRRLFEEAAGVTKYKQRRAQALRKLDGTQADLTRLRDLTDEIEKNVRRLARQAKKAERYHRLADRLQALEVALFAHDYARLATERAAVMKEAMQLRAEVDRQHAALARGEAEVEQARTALVAAEQALSEQQQAQFAHAERLRSAEAEQRLAAERAQNAETTLARLAAEADTDTDRRASLQTEQAALTEQRTAADTRRSDTAQSSDDAQAVAEQARRDADAQRDVLRAAQRSAQDAAKQVQSVQSALARLRDRRALRQAEAERLDGERAEAEAQRATIATDLDAADTAVAETWQTLEAAQAAFTEAEAERDRLDLALTEAQNALRDAQQTTAALRTEGDLLRSLLDTREDLDAPAAFLLDQIDWTDTPPQTVAESLACDEADRLALDAALGPWADALVVPNDTEAHAAIARLRNADQGRVTFLVLDRLPARASRDRSPTPPNTTPLRDLVRADDTHQPLIRLLLQNTFVADSLEEAETLREAYPIATLVTRAGEWTSVRGTYAGGPEKPRAAALRLGRRERLQDVTDAFAEAEARVTEMQTAVARVQAERSAVPVAERQQAQREARQALAGAEQAHTRHEAARHSLDQRLERLAARRTALDAELAAEADEATLTSDLDTAQTALDQAQAALSNAEEATLAADARQRDAQQAAADARLAAAEARNAADNLRRDAERIAQTLTDLDARAERRTADQTTATERRDEAQTQRDDLGTTIETLREKSGGLTTAVAEADLAVLRARSAANEREDALRTIRRAREEALQALNQRDLRLTEIQTRQATLAERAASEYGLAASDLVDRPIPDDLLTEPEDGSAESGGAAYFDAEEARTEIPALRDKIRGLGAVNALALEEYEEEEARLEQMVQQRDDLERAEATLLSTIDEINTTAAARFAETFEQVQVQFQRLFNDLFGGDAKASLVLDGDDPLEAAIEIKARPRGKKPSVLTQLSGGEKTLTAIALLFAIYLVKPSPFCILDEVDAPLDDANIGRFMTLLRSFAESTQFILVTHNKLTMEAADRMYGITMQEAGVSKLVGVRFDEVVEEPALAA
ncbi:MAG: chromosome segregation protein SMC [Bacteroidota bacterium]